MNEIHTVAFFFPLDVNVFPNATLMGGYVASSKLSATPLLPHTQLHRSQQLPNASKMTLSSLARGQ